jgi:glyoxylase-like metal-dependent hydrolase (beta-lactamase superfamily II)
MWLLSVTTFSMSAFAQYNQQKRPLPKGAGGETLTTQFVKTGLYLISGGGCNSLLRLTGNGLILVDGKLPGSYDALLAQVGKISEQPVRAVVLTDHNPCRSGNDAKFIAAGTGIIAQQNVTHHLANAQPGVEATPPSITFDRDYQVRLGGVEIQLMHFGAAHTDANTVVYFPGQKVVAVGDLFAASPVPDFAAGGSLVGWGTVLGEVLKLDFDLAVPGSGAPISKTDLQAYKTKMDTLSARATDLVKRGVPKDQFGAHLRTDDLGWKLNLTADQVAGIYAELAHSKQTADAGHVSSQKN